MIDEYDVFLSHTKDDEPFVEELASRLREEAELEPYFRRWYLIPGELLVPSIERAIESSATVAVFFGGGGPDAWRDQESQLVLIDQSDRRVIPVRLPDASVTSIEGFLRTRVEVDLAEQDGFERLVAGITGRAPELVTSFDPGPTLRAQLGAARSSKERALDEIARPTPYRVFLSSTSCEDQERRRELLEIIERVGMEACLAEPLPPDAGPSELAVRRRQLEGCDLFLMLVAWRYGSLTGEGHQSIGELEYEWARDKGMPRMVFLIDEERPVVVATDFDEADARWTKQERLQALKARVLAEETTTRFTAENIGALLTHSLHQWRSDGAVAGARARARAKPKATESKPSARTKKARKTRSRKTSSRRPARPARIRRATAAQVARYLDIIEHDNTMTSTVGASTPVQRSLHLDELQVGVRAVLHRRDGDADSTDETEREFELNRVFEEARREGCRVTVLVGPPGSGKSTHLRRFALWLSRRSAATLGLPLDTLPIPVPLRELPPDHEELGEAVAAYLGRHTGSSSSVVAALLRHEHLLFLVDGIDELPDPGQRERVNRWIDQCLRDRPQSRFMLTRSAMEPSATAAWTEPTLEVQLMPLGEREARTLVSRWFQATEPKGDANLIEAKRRADLLWAELKAPGFRATRMFALTRNPLLLSVLCALHRQRGALPTRRVELYEQCFQMLVRQWLDQASVPRRFGDREARQILQPLAHWLHLVPDRTSADARSIAPVLEPHLAAILGEDIDPEGFVHAASTAHGILTTKGTDRYGLLHRSFQDYLCARHLRSLSHGDPGVLDEIAERFGDPWWREVTLLLVALGEPPLFEPLMRRVVERPAFVEHLDLVLECHQEAAGATVEPFAELLRRDPADQPELWTRQLTAARVLEKVDPRRWSEISPGFREHPHEPLRRFVGQGDRPDALASRVSPRSGYTLVEIPAGSFTMGSHHRERGRRGSEGPRHQVELARFFIGKYLVTNEDYGHYLRARPDAPEPKYWGDPRYNHPRQPVVGVSWHEAMDYCEWAGLSLPTEAQWERACRGDTKTAYWTGRQERDLASAGWYATNSEQRLHAVGECDPNPFGLYDVHGNVWEWCLDEFGDYKDHSPRPGDGLRHSPRPDGNRVIRGGSWIDPAYRARSAYRLNRHTDDRIAYLGFRAVEPVETDDD